MKEFTKHNVVPLKVKGIETTKNKKKYENGEFVDVDVEGEEKEEEKEDEEEDEEEEEEEEEDEEDEEGEEEEEENDVTYDPKQKTEITFHLPDGRTEIMQENMGTEVGYLKLMLSQKLQKPYDKIHLLYNEKIMIDPLSIIDIIKENLKHINIQVNYID